MLKKGIARRDDSQASSLLLRCAIVEVRLSWQGTMTLRIDDLRVEDSAPLERLLVRVAVFEPHEIAVANVLVAAALAGSPDYLIYVARGGHEGGGDGDRVVGYVCHGHN